MNYSKLNILIRSNKKSIPEIALECGLTKATLYNIMNGLDTKVSTIEKLSSVLTIPTAELFLDDDESSILSARTTGDYSPAVSGVNENVTVFATSESDAIQKEKIARLEDKIKHLDEMLAEKERTISILLSRS